MLYQEHIDNMQLHLPSKALAATGAAAAATLAVLAATGAAVVTGTVRSGVTWLPTWMVQPS